MSSEYSNVRASLSIFCSIMRYVTQSYGHSGKIGILIKLNLFVDTETHLHGRRLKAANLLAKNLTVFPKP